tara:strand:- start:6186 stop:6719 length:534 start_codon:yes stop_codon:yes gene_type:complete
MQKPSKATRPIKTAEGHAFKEAFMLMKYVSKDGKTVETVWNSRDGVSPFMLGARDVDVSLDTMLQHAHWGSDIYAPYHVPNVGDRVFVDATEETERPKCEAYLDREWDGKTLDCQAPPGEVVDPKIAREQLIDELLKESLKPGAPAAVVVTAKMQAAIYAKIVEVERNMMQARGSKR